MGGGKGLGLFEGTRGSDLLAVGDNNRLFGTPGQVNRTRTTETWIGRDGRAVLERHLTDHSDPKQHTAPHDHIITWNENGNPVFSEPINNPPRRGR